MAWPTPMSVVEVEWVDSRSLGGWQSPEEYVERIGTDKLLCRSAGYLFRADEWSLVLMQSMSVTGNVCDAMVIPARAVRTITTIRVPTEAEEG